MTSKQPSINEALVLEEISERAKKRVEQICFYKDHPSVAAIHQVDSDLRALFRDCPPVRLGQLIINSASPRNDQLVTLVDKLERAKLATFQLQPYILLNRIKRTQRLIGSLQQRYKVKKLSELIKTAYSNAPEYIRLQLTLQLISSMEQSGALTSEHKRELASIYQDPLEANLNSEVYPLLDDIYGNLTAIKDGL